MNKIFVLLAVGSFSFVSACFQKLGLAHGTNVGTLISHYDQFQKDDFKSTLND